ncbi:MAG: Fic family protein/DNA-binding MarR family transcriptional regulator [Verrucomicrobiales bacterium]|jgi:Fic family protein/DNA-binding MarR family transcriptional regulator
MKSNQIGALCRDIEAYRVMSELTKSVDPMGIDAIVGSIDLRVSRATILRRLDQLRKVGAVERTGRARATRYFLTAEGRQALEVSDSNRPSPAHHPLSYSDSFRVREPTVDDLPSDFDSRDAEDPRERVERDRMRDFVHQPLANRPRVEYRREFLGDYEPNVTSYLPATLRAELRKAGQSDQMAQLPAGTYVRTVFNRVLIDLSWNSSRLEGNTYSLLETERLLEMGSEVDHSRTLEARMILNHKEAIEFLVDAPDDIGFNRYTILNLHSLLAHDLLSDYRSEGRLRHIAVGIGGSAFRPLDIPQTIEACFMEILEKVAAIEDPLEQAFFTMVHVPYLQPFEDVNKRTSRLAANIPLIRENLAPLSFVDVSQRDYTDAILAVYELNRVELLRDVFARAYRASAGRYAAVRRSIAPPDPMNMAYREAVRSVAQEVVQRALNKSQAALHIQRWAEKNVVTNDRARVVEIIETNLLSLHEGNFAKFRLRPSEFEAWQKTWNTP